MCWCEGISKLLYLEDWCVESRPETGDVLASLSCLYKACLAYDFCFLIYLS
jgi:hypothetical protein